MNARKLLIASFLTLATISQSAVSQAGEYDAVNGLLITTSYGVVGVAVISTATAVGMSISKSQDTSVLVSTMVEKLDSEIGAERTEALVKGINNCELIDASEFANDSFAKSVVEAYLGQRTSVCK